MTTDSCPFTGAHEGDAIHSVTLHLPADNVTSAASPLSIDVPVKVCDAHFRLIVHPQRLEHLSLGRMESSGPS